MFYLVLCVPVILVTTKTLYTIVQLLLEEFIYFSQVILKYTITMSHNKSLSRSQSLILSLELESRFIYGWSRSWSPIKEQGLRIPDR